MYWCLIKYINSTIFSFIHYRLVRKYCDKKITKLFWVYPYCLASYQVKIKFPVSPLWPQKLYPAACLNALAQRVIHRPRPSPPLPRTLGITANRLLFVQRNTKPTRTRNKALPRCFFFKYKFSLRTLLTEQIKQANNGDNNVFVWVEIVCCHSCQRFVDLDCRTG